MPTLSITWRMPGQQLRIVIIVVIYITVIRFVPHQAIPVILGSLIGPVLATEARRPTRHLSARHLSTRHLSARHPSAPEDER